MLLLKTSSRTLDKVVEEAKHATDTKPNARPGDLILIAETKTSLETGQKSIRYIMTYKGSRLDTENESQRIWGKKWKYMIDGYDVIEIPGFNLEEVQVSKKNYGPVVTHCRLEPRDEQAVLRYLSKGRIFERARSVTRPKNKSTREILKELQKLDSTSSDILSVKSKRYFRDPRKSALLKELYKYECQICGIVIKDSKGRSYIETHHIKKRSEGGRDDPTNMLVLCPNHHKMFDLGSARIDMSSGEIWINKERVNGRTDICSTCRLAFAKLPPMRARPFSTS